MFVFNACTKKESTEETFTMTALSAPTAQLKIEEVKEGKGKVAAADKQGAVRHAGTLTNGKKVGTYAPPGSTGCTACSNSTGVSNFHYTSTGGGANSCSWTCNSGYWTSGGACQVNQTCGAGCTNTCYAFGGCTDDCSTYSVGSSCQLHSGAYRCRTTGGCL